MQPAAYARYSSDAQRSASIADQLRNCRDWCERQGFAAPLIFADEAISGARTDRPQYRAMLAAAERREFNVLLVDDLSRLARDHIETAKALRRLAWLGVRVVGVSDGIDTERRGAKLEAGMRGLMAELYLDELAARVHRGLTGQALAGYSAGGLAYGYRSRHYGNGYLHEPDPAEAAIVREIFERYAAGESPRGLAWDLNRRGIPAARGRSWALSAIYPDRRRGLGILANRAYIGEQVWNRSQWIKHPTTGRRTRRERPRNEWIVTHDERLRIVSDELWRAAESRSSRAGSERPRGGRRPRWLLSGLLVCGECGSRLVGISQGRYGCGRRKQSGPAACSNGHTIMRRLIEGKILDLVRAELLTPEAFAAFQAAARRALNRAAQSRAPAEALRRAETERANILRAIRAGVLTDSTRVELLAAEQTCAELQQQIEAGRAAQPDQMLPRAREIWKSLIADLAQVKDTDRAREALRGILGDRITIRAAGGELLAELTPTLPALQSQITMVAGVGFEPTTFGL